MLKNVREEPPWYLLYANDIVLVAENREDLERRIELWRYSYSLESRGMTISRTKTEHMTNGMHEDQEVTISQQEAGIKRSEKCKYRTVGWIEKFIIEFSVVGITGEKYQV